MDTPTPATQPHKTRSPCRATLQGAMVCLLAVVVGLPGVLSAQPVEPAIPGPIEALASVETAPEARSAAAEVVIAMPDVDPALASATVLLTDATPDAARALLAAISRSPQPGSIWFAPCVELARADSSLTRDAVHALGSFRSRESVAVLVDIVADSRPPEIEAAAAQSLKRLTGRSEIPPGAWRDYLASSLSLSDRQWEEQLLRAHIEAIQKLQADARDTDRRLVEAWRQIHLLTPQDNRSDLLVHLLTSSIPVLRDLGFDLVNREIGESRQLEPAVGLAAIDLLGSADARIRARAALLLNRLAPPEAEAAVLSALDRETDPRAADALLFAASRWPAAVTIKPLLRWMETSPSLRVRAADTAWALLRADLLTVAADREAVLAGVRAIEPPALTGPACRLLATLGSEEDLARLHALLTAEDPPTRVMAADALALRADQVDTLLAAATSDASLFASCAKALGTHLHDARGYAALANLPAPSPAVRSRVLADYAALLPTAEIVRLARLAGDAAEALHLLRPLTAAERAADPAAAPQLAEGLLLLSETYLALDNPTDALNTLALIPEETAPFERAVLDDLRVGLLLRLNRIEQAEAVGGSVVAWLDSLEAVLTESHAGSIADRLAVRFPELSPEQAERFATLRQRLTDATAATEPPPSEPAPSEGG